MDEIDKCFKSSPLSLPVFIHLGFDRYGWVPIPAEIKSEIFEDVRQKSDENESSLLDKCFIQDLNNIPAIHKLRPYTEIGGNFDEMEPRLRQILFRNTELAHQMTSMTEQEVKFALELDPNRVISVTAKHPKAGSQNDAQSLIGIERQLATINLRNHKRISTKKISIGSKI